MMAPQTIIDYIVVHELCHFHHRDHTDSFWNEVDKVIPDYREREEWLRGNGRRLGRVVSAPSEGPGVKSRSALSAALVLRKISVPSAAPFESPARELAHPPARSGPAAGRNS